MASGRKWWRHAGPSLGRVFKKYWWACPVAPDHIWQAHPSNRTKVFRPSGCPCCAGKQVSITNSLAALFPEVAAQLHPDKNNGVTADQIVARSHSKYWWLCLALWSLKYQGLPIQVAHSVDWETGRVEWFNGNITQGNHRLAKGWHSEPETRRSATNLMNWNSQGPNGLL